jgi:hypothetical protein
MFARKSHKIVTSKTVRIKPETETDHNMRAQLIALRKAIHSRLNGQVYLAVSPSISPGDERASRH